jgi:hypothetical protein
MTVYAYVFVTLLLASLSSASQSTIWKQVESFRFNWDGHQGVLVVLEIPADRTDPGDFTRVRIRVPGHQEFTLLNDDGWVSYRSQEASTSREIRNQGRTQRSMYVLALAASRTRTMLFLFGYSYASSPGSLDVIEISRSGELQVIFHRDEFGLKDVRDLDGDGVAELIGYPCLSQEFGDGLLTYDPFNVLKLSRSGERAYLSLPLSKSYNLEHYYGWAGAECSESISVVLHPPNGGKPMLMKTKDAEQLTSGKQ